MLNCKLYYPIHWSMFAHNNKIMKINITTWVVIAFLSVSCINRIDNLTFTPLTPGVAVPVGKFTLNADKLTQIGNSLMVQEGGQGVIELFYNTELLRAPLFDRLSIPNQAFSDNIPFTSFIFLGGVVNEVKLSQFNSFTISNIDLITPAPELEHVIFKAGTLSITQLKDFDHQLITTISFPTLKKDGVPIEIILNDNTPVAPTTLNLADLDLTGVSGTSFNTIDYKISVVVRKTGVDVTGNVAIDFSMSNLEFSFIKGDFKTYAFSEVANTFSLGLPQSNFPDNIAFTNPSVEIGVLNSSGIEYGLDINELSITKPDNSVVLITGTYDDATLLVAPSTFPGEIVQSDFLINNVNTENLIPLLNDIPSSVFFKGLATANPNGAPIGLNFVTDTSELVVNAKLVLPLEGYVNGYALTDTIKAKLNIDTTGVFSLENINLRLQVENNFPFTIGLQMYFLDAIDSTIILDSLFLTKADQEIFPAAQVDNSGLVIAPTSLTSDISIDHDKYERIKDAGSTVLVATLSTPGAADTPQKSVRIATSNYLTLGLGISAQAYVDPNAITN